MDSKKSTRNVSSESKDKKMSEGKSTTHTSAMKKGSTTKSSNSSKK